MPDVDFLEEKPLYSKTLIDLPNFIQEIEKVNINMFCDICKNERTFNMTNRYTENASHVHPNHLNDSSWDLEDNKYMTLDYLCASCNEFQRFFVIKFDENLNYVQKIGQFPPLDISIPKYIRKAIGEYEDYYKKGRISENFGYGIGAHAYYRRIIEGIIDELLDRVSNLFPEDEKKIYEEALSRAKKEKNATAKIEIVKDLVPPILIQGRYNPLKTLHESLSIGIHVESDEVCIENAIIIRKNLEFLVEAIYRGEERSKEYVKDMDNLKKKLEKYK